MSCSLFMLVHSARTVGISLVLKGYSIMGQLILELSSEVLTAAFRNIIRGLLPCPKGPFYTDVDISRVTAIRGDDQDPDVQKIFKNLQIDPLETRTIFTHFPPSELPDRIASTFVLVTASMHLVDEKLLDSVGTTETQPLWEFQNAAVGPGEFLFRISKVERLGHTINIHLHFEGI